MLFFYLLQMIYRPVYKFLAAGLGWFKSFSGPESTDKLYHNKYGSQYLQMSLEEKRALYKCGKKFLTLEGIPKWSEIWQKNKDNLETKGNKSLAAYQVRHALNDKISLIRDDITRLEIDGIVNAANESLAGGGGVDGAIHDAAGGSLYDECMTLGGCQTGDAKITSGHQLPAKFIVHTVGPRGEKPTLLKSCYRRSLDLAHQYDVKALAFPCISTGIYGYPPKEAAKVALSTVREWLEVEENAEKIDRIIFCVFLKDDWDIYIEQLQIYFPCDASNDADDNLKNARRGTLDASHEDSEKEPGDIKNEKELAVPEIADRESIKQETDVDLSGKFAKETVKVTIDGASDTRNAQSVTVEAEKHDKQNAVYAETTTAVPDTVVGAKEGECIDSASVEQQNSRKVDDEEVEENLSRNQEENKESAENNKVSKL